MVKIFWVDLIGHPALIKSLTYYAYTCSQKPGRTKSDEII